MVALDLVGDPPGGADAIEAVVDVDIPVELSINVASSNLRRGELSELRLTDFWTVLNRVVPDLEQLLLHYHMSAVVLGEVIAGLHFIA